MKHNQIRQRAKINEKYNLKKTQDLNKRCSRCKHVIHSYSNKGYKCYTCSLTNKGVWSTYTCDSHVFKPKVKQERKCRLSYEEKKKYQLAEEAKFSEQRKAKLKEMKPCTSLVDEFIYKNGRHETKLVKDKEYLYRYSRGRYFIYEKKNYRAYFLITVKELTDKFAI